MPSTSLGQGKRKVTLDARPDRIDYRDREYQPPLVSLPAQYPAQSVIDAYFPLYSKKLILDQGQEGACTGFGLAAALNYLLFRQQALRLVEQADQDLRKLEEIESVSPRMLYQMARIYDEWPGEDYEGSSCRGAMKGWFRHGVCLETRWPYRDKKQRVRFLKPATDWQRDAASRPLGAYYRINKDSIVDMQAAINEVGAIYVSATVHEGWMIGREKTLPVLGMSNKDPGGHAFALVGYTAEGFIVQNSWGPKWGYYGFAILTYQDWVQHGADAWVAVLGAPMVVSTEARTRRSASLQIVESGRSQWFWRGDRTSSAVRYQNSAVEPLSESDAYEHTVVLGNNGRPLNSFLDVADAAAAVSEAALVNPARWLAANKSTKLAIYTHGGLNDEAASIKRVRVMAPYFLENGIYPLFITWKTGFLESISGMLEDVVVRFLVPGSERPQGWFENFTQQILDARNRSIEVACQQVLVKAVWSEMKQNAEAAEGTGLSLLNSNLATLKGQVPDLEIHLVGHSAGSILLGHLLDRFASKKLTASTCTLYAPACTLAFALRHYGRAHTKKVLSKRKLYCDVMSEERERADSVGPYGKSLLYLVSRALEDVHKMPLLGMQRAWQGEAPERDLWNEVTRNDLKAWHKFAGSDVKLKVHPERMISDGLGQIPLTHGSFDNDVNIVAATLERIRGGKLAAKVERLRDF